MVGWGRLAEEGLGALQTQGFAEGGSGVMGSPQKPRSVHGESLGPTGERVLVGGRPWGRALAAEAAAERADSPSGRPAAASARRWRPSSPVGLR